MNKLFIGTSGWQYQHWQPVFYPQNCPQKDWLSYYNKYFDTVEVNATFYHQMKKETFKKWRETVGPNFVFAIKGNRYITHLKRLKDCREEAERFFSGVRRLRFATGRAAEIAPQQFSQLADGALRSGAALAAVQKNTPFRSSLGGTPPRAPAKSGRAKIVGLPVIRQSIPSKNVILWQLPPQMVFDKQKLKKFLALLPKTFRQALEFRHQSWLRSETYSLLKEYNCALVIQDSPNWPSAEIVTADFVYLRFHGRQSLYVSCYSDKELDEWARKVKQWLDKGNDVYGYFNNDAQGFAVQNARTLKNLLSDGRGQS